jgi:hypothetical protein
VGLHKKKFQAHRSFPKGLKKRQKPKTRQTCAIRAIKDIRRATHEQYFAKEKTGVVVGGLRGDSDDR